ncbi:MAG: lipopolysaccharide biosynthesis protein [Bacteroidales bacterium]|nr:lipopolysaccharide biosynthesis protein [Bacteroidales bacterium]
MTETKDLKNKAASSMVWSAVQKYSTMLISFVADIILARLLTPYDFGCIGMLAIFLVLAETFIDGGFGSALIQKKRPTQVDYSTVFWWNLGMAVLLYTVLFFCAPIIARFYGIPLLCSVLRVQGVILFIYAFNVIQRNQLKKKLNFKVLSIITLISQVVSLVVTILMAYQELGVWALVARHLVAAAITSVFFWFYVRWRPVLVFSWQSFKELFGFGFYMFLAHLVTRFSTKFQGLLIGKVYTPATMGFYSKAAGTENLASTSISQIMDQVTYPLYAEAQDDMVKMQNMVKRLTMTLSYITFPLMFLLILIAKPLFILLYTEKWSQSIPYFQVLCIAGLAQCLQSVNMQTISAIGKSKVTFVWTFVKRLLGIGFIVGGLALWGMKGLLCGAVLNNWFAYFVNMGLVSKHVGYKWYRQLWDLFPVLAASMVAAIMSYVCGYFLHLNMYLDGIMKLVVYVVLYFGWSFVFKPDAYKYFLTVLDSLFSKFKKNKQKML